MRNYNKLIQLNYYLTLRSEWKEEFPDCDIDFTKSFYQLSLSQNKIIESYFKYGGLRRLLRKFDFQVLFNYKKIYQDSIDIVKNKNKKTNRLKSQEGLASARLKAIIKNGCKVDLLDYISPWVRFEFLEECIGVRHLPIDKNFENLKTTNIIPIPKGMTIKEFCDLTNTNKKFYIYPQLEAMLKTQNIRKCFDILLKQTDKVWLNHNIVCIIMDKFVEPFIRSKLTKTKNVPKSHYFLLNKYAKKFGIFPIIDRLVLSFWKAYLIEIAKELELNS